MTTPTAATTRRNILKTVPAMFAATALPGYALAAPGGAEEDSELRRLWLDYLDAATAYMAARDAHDPARDAYDAEVAPDGITPALAMSGTYCKGPLWDETVEPLWQAVNDAGDRLRATITAIRATPAEGIAGVAIKILAQLSRFSSDPDDMIDGFDAVQPDIARLTGLTSPWIAWEGADEETS